MGRLTPLLHQNYRSPSCKQCGGVVCWYVTYILWPWPFYLEQVSYMAGHVTNLATKFEDPMPVRSWVMSYNVSRWLPLKMRTHCNGACDALLACDFTSSNVAKYCDDRVCLCVCLCIYVCLSASISLELHVWSSLIFCACYLWPLLALWCIVYFLFYNLCHICTKWAYVLQRC